MNFQKTFSAVLILSTAAGSAFGVIFSLRKQTPSARVIQSLVAMNRENKVGAPNIDANFLALLVRPQKNLKGRTVLDINPGAADELAALIARANELNVSDILKMSEADLRASALRAAHSFLPAHQAYLKRLRSLENETDLERAEVGAAEMEEQISIEPSAVMRALYIQWAPFWRKPVAKLRRERADAILKNTLRTGELFGAFGPTPTAGMLGVGPREAAAAFLQEAGGTRLMQDAAYASRRTVLESPQATPPQLAAVLNEYPRSRLIEEAGFGSYTVTSASRARMLRLNARKAKYKDIRFVGRELSALKNMKLGPYSKFVQNWYAGEIERLTHFEKRRKLLMRRSEWMMGLFFLLTAILGMPLLFGGVILFMLRYEALSRAGQIPAST